MISPLLAPKPAKITIPPFSRRNAATARYHLLPAESHRPFSNEAPRPNRANPERPGNRGSTPRPPAAVLIDLARRVPLFIPAGRGAIILNPRRPRPCAGSLARGQRYGRLTKSGLASAAMTNPTENPAPFAGRDLACRRGERMVFARLNFLLEPGGLLVLRGANGSGKSSLLRLMAGLLRPVEGALTWGGQSFATDPELHRRRLAFLGHLDALKAALTAAENLAFWCGIDSVAPALAAFGIDRLARLPARLLSAGQRRRLALARIFASGAPLWLLDEPTNGLDGEAEAMFAGVLAEHRAKGGMAAIALHGDNLPPGVAVLALGDFAPQCVSTSEVP